MERIFLNTHPYTVAECDRQLAVLEAAREVLLHRKLFLSAQDVAVEYLEKTHLHGLTPADEDCILS